jgi:hypothetical protein
VAFIEIDELEKKFPFAFKYLSQFKEELKKRDIKPEPKTENEWYRYGRHQSLDKCEVQEKIVVGILSLGDKYAIDYQKTVLSSGGNGGYCIISIPEDFSYSTHYIQALLNSKYVEWYCSLIGSIFRGGYVSHGTQVLNRLPIVKIDFQNSKKKELHDNISKTQKEMIDIQTKIDENSQNSRVLIPLQRQFEATKQNLDEFLKDLFCLGEDENFISLTLKKDETH